MNVLAFCLALGVLPAFGETLLGRVAPITLYSNFQNEPPQTIREAIHDELEQIMSPIGMQFEWRSLSGVRGSEVSVELAVVTFKGRCDTASLAARSAQLGALGWTHISDGSILPFSDVDCDRIRGFIQLALLALPREEREEAFGRAVGRVLAHELYHIFANTQKHGSSGVAKESYTVEDLMAPDFVFEEKQSRALRASKPHAELGVTSPGSGASPTTASSPGSM